jgi:hypothetical protein
MTVRGVHDRGVMQVATEGTGQQPGGAGRPKPHRITQLPQAEDEATPNTALITLLQSVSHFAQAKLEWIIPDASAPALPPLHPSFLGWALIQC